MQTASEAQEGSDAPAAMENAGLITQPSDHHHIAVLRKAEWQRIQDKLNPVCREEELLREAAQQRKALHLKSQEVVKHWPDSIADQIRKKLEAKKIRERIEEEKRKQIDFEEAIYQEQKRKEAIEKANSQLYYQTDRVKGLHSALLLTKVLKEREVQLELQQRKKDATTNNGHIYLNAAKEEEAFKKEQEKEKQRRIEREANAEHLKHQMREKDIVREQERLESKREGEEIQRLQELYQAEQRMESEEQETKKRNLMRAHLEHVAHKDLIKASDAQREEAEEERRKVYLSNQQKMAQLLKHKEKERQEAQMCRETILHKLIVTQQEQTSSEEERIALAVAEQDAKQARLQLKEEERKAAMLKSIIEHRELMQQEKELKDKRDKQKKQDELEARKEMLRISSKKQELQAKKQREVEKRLQDFHVSQMVERNVLRDQLRLEEQQLAEKNAELTAMEDVQFQRYSHGLISAAAETQHNVFPLCKAARAGFGGGPSHVGREVRKGYLGQDSSGDAEMTNSDSTMAKNIKKLHEASNLEEAKRRLGFML